ncbi:hypothetical protein A3G67_03600 [Candidatus Roizmanbacteria bacterium RIFCSPLOWO2_12_FULL_40_12]|uniref:Bacterial type II secretion system protein E domain-containing protein n=1 Tax=Candidatus Roizmanbacteria bacterium RIFCSPLOWO2_01_FULL_40_42 TaxID=1802066 RepID=A0A1F7J5N1_9BACT|nr:MAG: hypothetical protein A2779_03235 [Candidatus Roizmanbacteria bacterium RIFCSPHIGHO2_01_FULL_40_98]OGK28353.1 MAG: hypothetical protein A3C31_00600 [Candidatus Roizmanbacteria bacterium RIFCSPHIGHO2_02_FULL_40_53]OGK30589.1 MAG: hypothetical protein A2W49_03285 [Candidatus Roizmanbacteria bacterium RIFCSPHIGHO2_12_41_18]OGK37003.1 MAG: hypothetical protein A3E69_00860 [Candidatus Roizmanbacteria bacterium RIFCSPHIGHO2_12_FULL_40_130]OGK50909.1 MAG: hypothetical protein A3B50_01370 [Candi
MEITKLFELTIERAASDLHLVAGTFPSVRVDGVLYQLSTLSLLTPEISEKMLFSILNEEQKENLIANKEIDLGYEYSGNRFRVNIYHTRGGWSGSFRLIPSKIRTIEQLALPESFHNLTEHTNGLVLVTGPTGEGKSTTLSAIINEINLKHAKHIITIEDPIEFVYSNGKSIISQRELHQDTHSWNIALRSVLREDPDVVLVGEIRDYESAQLVLTIAETGHLVFSTLHTTSVPETVNRLIDMFPSHQQNQIKTQLAGALRTIVAQRLLPRSDMKGRVAALEVMHNTSAVASIIRDGKPFLLENLLQTSDKEGFIYFERYLSQLVQQGHISKETAYAFAIRPKELEKYIK